jgi:ribonucleoside-diphosphate reductase beta chain
MVDTYDIEVENTHNFTANGIVVHNCNFACALYSFIEQRVPKEDVMEMIKEANEISEFFIHDAIKCKLIGMDTKLMIEYVNYVSDRLLVMLNYDKLYNVQNPFDFMETIGMLSKDNFFENRPDSYQKSHNENNKEKWTFKRLVHF